MSVAHAQLLLIMIHDDPLDHTETLLANSITPNFYFLALTASVCFWDMSGFPIISHTLAQYITDFNSQVPRQPSLSPMHCAWLYDPYVY